MDMITLKKIREANLEMEYRWENASIWHMKNQIDMNDFTYLSLIVLPAMLFCILTVSFLHYLPHFEM